MREGTLVADRFEVQRLAGSGGMGVVYRANDQLTGRPVALKVAAQELQARFRREARLLEAVKHPHIVQHIAHGTNDDGASWLVMEWLEGETLQQRLRHGPLTIPESLLVGQQVAEALAAVHSLGITHRDLKPSNVLLRDGRVDGVVLLDFGIARADTSTTFLTEASSLVGSLGYMAPEQARGGSEVDSRADVFALGVLLFECLSAQRPFAADDPLAEMCRILLEEPPRLVDRRPDAPAIIDDLIARLLAKDPGARIPDGRAAAAALAELRIELARSPDDDGGEGPPSVTGDERRLISVVLVGAPSGEQDAADVIDAADQVLADIASSHGGVRERLLDGTGMVLLSSQTEDTRSVRSGSGMMHAFDLAARAATCALAIRARLPSRPVSLATGRAQVREHLPTGDVIDRAVARLREARDDVRIDEVTAGLTVARFDVVGEGLSFALKGERDTAESERTLLGRVTTFVGRDRELGMLRGLFDQCVDEPVARVALVLGEAGMGKSRLRFEFLRAVRSSDASASIYVARGEPLAAGAPFGMLGQVVHSGMGFLPGDSLETRRSKLREHVARDVPAADAQRVAWFLGELASTPFDDPDSALRAAHEDALLMGEQIRRAMQDWLAARCARGPVVMVFEDMQWGDYGSVTVLDEVLQALVDRPLLVLGFARQGVMETFPGLWVQRGVQHIKLGALTPRAAERLVRSALGDDIDQSEVARLVEHADGHPFFLEELVRVRAEGRSDLPLTVVALMHTRIEGLPAEARRTLRAASVFGGSFSPGGVRQLLGAGTSIESLDLWLKSLIAQELIVTRRVGSRYPGHEELTFRHALVRDAAYGMLTDGDRAAGHRMAARWLQSVGETDGRVLAEHFERGGEPERAVDSWLSAAREALESNDLDAALACAERGLAVPATICADVLHVDRKGRLNGEGSQWPAAQTAALDVPYAQAAALDSPPARAAGGADLSDPPSEETIPS